MIQRIQTVYLFLLFAIGLILIWQDPVYAWFDGVNQPSAYVLLFCNSYSGTPAGTEVIYVADLMTIFTSALSMGLAVVSIFLFKNRKLQMKAVLFVVLLCLLVLGILLLRYYLLKRAHPELAGHLGFPLVWPALMAVSALMAFRSIKADEEMVRGMDRIR
jgi:hypothetical protein